MLRAEGDPDRKRDRPGLVEVRFRDLPRHPVGKGMGGREIAGPDDDRELLAAGPAHVVRLAHDAAELRRELRQHLVADGVPVDVVDALEIVEIEHQQRHRRRLLGGNADDLVAKPLVERAVVPEARERVGLGLELEACARVGVVERERGSVAESNGQGELLLAELREAHAVDVERALIDPRAMSGTAINNWVGRLPSTNLDARVEVGPVRKHGLAVRHRPAGDALAEAERLVGDHLLGVVSRGQKPQS